MRGFRRFIVLVAVVFVAGVVLANGAFLMVGGKNNKSYNVEANRLLDQYNTTGEITEVDVDACVYIKGVEFFVPAESEASFSYDSYEPYEMRDFFAGVGYIIRPVFYDGEFVGYAKFSYTSENKDGWSFLFWLNGVFVLVGGCVAAVLLYLKYVVLDPAKELKKLPQTLARGDFITQFETRKDTFWEEFLREFDMLRETLNSERQEARLTEAKKAQRALSLIHDIKMPLTAIMLFAQALQRDLRPDVEKRKDLPVRIFRRAEEIQTYVVWLQAAISEVVPNLPVKEGVFYLGEVAARAAEAYKLHMEGCGIEFTLAPHANCLLKGDGDRVFESLCNLLENAMKYGDRKSVSIEFSQEEEGCQGVSVVNSGNSLPVGESGHIFECFWRGSNAQRTMGSGLGLFIVRQVCAQMGGEAFVVCEGDTFGVTMVFCLA
ncbi:MAG: HAMP domain-containing histidine kinase [Peptococcaceae bacterium]|nr:HAMP domain-containing histidine kinase [Peptococcaceae bacterium]